MKEKTCYMCDKKATSSEHVPPKCLFPEQKDSDGVDYRINLITVPSCDAHNGSKSKNDEYLFLILSINKFSSDPAEINRRGKIMRLLDRSPRAVVDMLGEPRFIKENGRCHPSFKVDQDRLFDAISHIANGLYFHHKKKKVNNTDVEILKGFSFRTHERLANVSKINQEVSNLFAILEWHGENRDVFKYKVVENKEATVFLLCFYNELEFLSIHS